MKNTEIKLKISVLEKDLVHALEKCKVKDSWSNLWRQHILSTFENTCIRINQLAQDKMQIYDTALEARPFWMSIMNTVEKSLWTTNIASRNSYGNSLNNLLKKQRETIDRNVKIQRVFIYDDTNPREWQNLVNVMTNQLFYGIEVYTIESNVFQHCMQLRGIKSNTNDFMVLDDTYVYENNYIYETDSYRNRLTKENDEVNKMIKLKLDVMRDVRRITLNNINEFPNII